MKYKGLLLFVVLLFIVVNIPLTICVDQTITISELRKQILSQYDNRFAPPEEDGESYAEINIALYVRSINHFDEVNGVLKSTVMAPIWWHDNRVMWDYNATGVDYISLSSQEVWVPNIMIENSVENFLLFNPEVSYPIDSHWDGYLSIQYGGLIISKCNANVKFYPFDKHQCNITLGTIESFYSHVSNNLEVHYKKPAGDIVIVKENAQWRITIGEPSDVVTQGVKLVNFPIMLERRPNFTVITLIVPIIFLCLVNVFVFCIPPTSGERMSFAITVLLAFSVYMSIVSAKVPESDPVPLYNLFLVFKLTYSATIALCAILSVRLYEKEGEVSPGLQRFVLCCNKLLCCCCCCCCCCSRKKSKSEKQNPVPEERKTRYQENITPNWYTPERIHHRIHHQQNGEIHPYMRSRYSQSREQNDIPLNTEEERKEITWKHVSNVIDKICFVVFFLIVVVEILLSFAFTLEKSLSNN